MNIQGIKLELVKLILETDNPALLKSVKYLFKKEKQTDYWETLSQGQKEDILDGVKEAESGDLLDYKEFILKHK
jgi:hypothetical protein